MAARRVDGDRPVPAARPRSASAPHAFGPPVPHAMVFLQRAAGNRAVKRRGCQIFCVSRVT